jgi:hypothetical protein
MVRSKPRKTRSTSQVRARSNRAATVGRDGFGVTTVTIRSKSGVTSVVRSSQTGRFTTGKSARVIDRGVERFAGPLKRLATK